MSDGVWLLTTAREDRWRGVAEACTQTGMSRPLLIRHDNDPPQLGPLMQRTFAEYPDADYYGWLADDTYPRTQNWDATLSEAAGAWKLAYADDGGNISKATLERGLDLSSGLCWGGELVRAVGWWALPGLTAAWIDVAWTNIISVLGLHAYCPDVLVDHEHWQTGRRGEDVVDQLSRASIAATRDVYDRWLAQEYPRLIRRLGRLLPADL